MVKEINKPAIIYMATSPSGRKYVGITVASLRIRKSNHLSHAKTKKPYAFQKAILKYGIDSFKWEILESTDSYEQAKEQEKYYIKYFNTRKSGYNRTDGGDGVIGHVSTDEQRRRISQRLLGNKYCLGRKLPDEHKENISRAEGGKPIFVYDEFGNLIKRFCSLKECATALGAHRANITRTLAGKKISQYNKYFSFDDLDRDKALLHFREKYDKLRIYSIDGGDAFLQQHHSKVARLVGVPPRSFAKLAKKQKFFCAGHEVTIR